MAINLLKNKETLQQAWKDVLEYEKSGVNWALFGYDGQTFDLKLVGKGDGGLEEMIEEFNSGKIMYAFCRVMDPKTTLPKFVLINWQGEGAPGDKKGRCANHIRDVNNFFKGAHVTINARTDDDVDPEIVVAQVVKATASAYSFGERADPLQDHKPIGSVYKRTIPTAEINPTERDRFWEKEEADERRRLAEEQKKAADAKKMLDDERRQRELQDAQRREEVVKEKSKCISQLRASEKVRGVGAEVERQKWQRQMEDDAREEADKKRRSDSFRQERTEEVQALISKRTINARAIFEQNTSAGQLSTIKHRPPALRTANVESTNGASTNNGADSLGNSSASISSPASIHSPPSINSSPPSRHSKTLSPDDRTPPSPAPDSTPRSYWMPNGNGTNAEIAAYSSHQSHSSNNLLKGNLPPRQPDSDDEHQEDDQQDWEATPVQHHSVTSSEQRSLADESSNRSNDDVQINEVSSAQTTAHRAQLAFVDNHSEVQDGGPEEYVHEGQGLTARALYDYEAADDTEISFNPDDIITNIDQIDEGWWQGLALDGTYGLFPANYVELLE